jgi:hypothetical protein
MKIKLYTSGGSLLRSLTVEGGGELHRTPESVVIATDPVGTIYRLTQRDDPDGAQCYTRCDAVLVLDK